MEQTKYAILVDFDEAYAKMDDGTIDVILKEWCSAVNIDPNGRYVAFLYRTQEEQQSAFPHIKTIYPSAELASRAAHVEVE